MDKRNLKSENMINAELKAIKPDLENVLELINRARKISKEEVDFAEKSLECMEEAQKICGNVKNRINSLID